MQRLEETKSRVRSLATMSFSGLLHEHGCRTTLRIHECSSKILNFSD